MISMFVRPEADTLALDGAHTTAAGVDLWRFVLPAQLIRPMGGGLLWQLDDESAAHLGRRSP